MEMELARQLAALASAQDVPAVDLPALRAGAVRRRRIASTTRAAAVAGVVLVSALVGPSLLPNTQAGIDRLAATPTTAPATPPHAPNERELRAAIAKGFPDADIIGVGGEPAGRLAPDASILGAVNRTRALPGVYATFGDGTLTSVGWQVIDPPLSDAEADRVARGIVPPDPNPVPDPDAILMPTAGRTTGRIHSVAYAYDGQIHAWAWSADGGVAQASALGTGADNSLAALLATVARELVANERDE